MKLTETTMRLVKDLQVKICEPISATDMDGLVVTRKKKKIGNEATNGLENIKQLKIRNFSTKGR